MIACLPGFEEVCDLVHSMSDAVTSVAALVKDPFRWLFDHLFPQDFLRLLGGQLDPASAGDLLPRLYRATVPAGVTTAAIAATARVVRAAFDERTAGLQVVGDNALRFGGAVLLLAAPTPAALTSDGMPVGWQLMRLGVGASTRIAGNVVGLLSSPSVFAADVSTRALVGRVIALAGASTVPVIGFFFAIILILAGLGLVYLAMIMVTRSIMLAFAVASAPVCIATAVFDHRNRFFQWWWDLFSGALLIPLVLSFVLALTTGFALHFGEGEAAFLPAVGVLLGGMWFAGKAVHQLTWRHFSHGGVTGAITALSTTAMAAPGIAAQASGMLTAAGHAPRAGGLIDTLAAMQRGGRSSATPAAAPTASGRSLALGQSAGDLVASAEAESTLARVGAAAGADFGAALPDRGLLGASEVADQVNRAAGAAVGRFAETPAGAASVMAATAGLPAETQLPDRVAVYARQLGHDPAVAGQVAQATVGSLLGGRLPDLTPVLSPAGSAGAEAGS